MDSMDNRGVVDTPCKHKFCLECYTKLEDPRCPLCRSDIPLGILGPYLHNERERTTHNRVLEDEWYANSPHAPDDDEFTQNPLRFVRNLIDDFMRDSQNDTHQDPTHLPTLQTISGYGYIIIGLSLIIFLLSPYTFITILSLVLMMYSPISIPTVNPTNDTRTSYLSESLLNNIFPRQYNISSNASRRHRQTATRGPSDEIFESMLEARIQGLMQRQQQHNYIHGLMHGNENTINT